MLKTGGLGALLEVEMSKSARRCGAKHISKSKVLKTEGLGDILDVQTSFCVAGGVDCASTEK